jgi:BirA family biotin operon repressor/biotin-[acetyl-CoA-carboxylase] ligase
VVKSYHKASNNMTHSALPPESSPASAPPLLNLDRLASELQTCAVGHTIHYEAKVPSTMPIARDLAQQPQIESGALVVAEEQTAGRGRFERRWHAPFAQALLVSIILKPPRLDLPPTHLPMAGGLAALQAVAAVAPATANSLWLKWPNDLLLGSTPPTAGKLAGVLAEAAFEQNRLAYAVLGIGVNVNQEQHTLPPVQPDANVSPMSLRVFTGQPHDRTALLIQLCRRLAHILTLPAAAVLDSWSAHLATLGQAVTIRDHDHLLFTGQAVGVTAGGELIIEDAAGHRRAFAAGEVTRRITR